MKKNLIEIVNNTDETDYDYIIINVKKEIQNFTFVDIINNDFFNGDSMQKIDDINKELNRIFCVDYNEYKNDLLKSFTSPEEIKKQFNKDIPRCNFF